MKKLLALPLSALLLFLLAACGAGGPVQGNLDQTTAQEFEGMATESAEYQMSLLREPIVDLDGLFSTSALSPSASAAFSTLQSCEPTGSFDETDSDGDGYPVGGTMTYNCTDSSGGVTVSTKGTISAADKNDSDANSGYELDMDGVEISMNSSSGSFSINLDLAFDLTITGAVYDSTFDFALSMDESSSDPVSIEYDLEQTYTANDASNPWAGGGTLDFAGTMSLVEEGTRYTMNTADIPTLTYDETCTTNFSDGGAEFSDSASNSLTINYDCDTSTARFNGSTL